MEDKRGTKRARSPSKEGNSSPSSAKTPPLAPCGSPLPLKSLPEVSSHCPCSPVLEQGGSSGKAPVAQHFVSLYDFSVLAESDDNNSHGAL
jgi:hypothetical protein